MAERRAASRRASFDLREFAQPIWRRVGFWQLALASVALIPLALAAVVRWSPIAPVAMDVPPPAPAEPLELRPLERPSADPTQVAAIASHNLFAPSRQDWAPIVVETEAVVVDDTSLKTANEALDKVSFVGVFRVGDDWRAMFDEPGRAPDQDLTVVGVGAVIQDWTILEISKDAARLEFRGTERTLLLRPKVAAKLAKADAPRKGRADVSARPAEGKKQMFYDPPISLDEARKQLRDALQNDPPEVIERLEDLFRSLEDDA